MNWKKSCSLLALITSLAAFIYLGCMLQSGHCSMATLQVFIKSHGYGAGLVFIALFITATLLLIPGAAMAILAGGIFGFSYGLLLSVIGSSLGALTAFMVGRYLAADWVNARMGGKARQLTTKVANMGWRIVAIVRLTPFMPFDVINFALGTTKISAFQYTIATIVFMLPGMVFYNFLGSKGAELLIAPVYLLLSNIFLLTLVLTVYFSVGKLILSLAAKCDVRDLHDYEVVPTD